MVIVDESLSVSYEYDEQPFCWLSKKSMSQKNIGETLVKHYLHNTFFEYVVSFFISVM
jgi:hypothetical protein